MTYPTIRPELTLDFANSRQLDPRITFSRSSSATYLNPDTGLITLASDHEARFEKEGLLIEESRANYNFYSNDFSNAHYVNVSNSLTETNTTAPDGSNDAISFGEVVGQNTMAINPDVSTQTFTSSTASVYVKVFGSRQYFSIREVNATNNWVRAVFDCTGEGSFKTVEGDVVTKTGFTPDIKNVGNGWYRCSLNVTYSTAQQVGFYFNPSDSDTGGGNTSSGFGQPAATPIAGSGFVLWGYQQEAGSFPTSLIPTAGATATRAVDIAQITGTNFSSWYNQGEGTFTVDASYFGGVSDFKILIEGSGGGSFRDFSWSLVNLSPLWQSFLPSIEKQINLTKNVSLGVPFKVAGSYGNGDASAAFDGVLKTTGPTAGVFSPADSLVIGRRPTGGSQYVFNGHFSRLAYYPRRLTDLELETITL